MAMLSRGAAPKLRKMVFITNQSARSAAWEEIIKAKQNTGDWYHFIIDLDILVILLYFLGYENF